MKIEEALFSAGVREDSLTNAEKIQLDSEGYLVISGVMNGSEVTALQNRIKELLQAEGEHAGKEVHQEAGTDRLSDLMNKSPLFHILFKKPKTLAAIAHVLKNDIKLSSLNFRNALPGQGHQGLHADWGRLETPGDYQVCNTLWLLDDFTEDNGATRIVPRTHNNANSPADELGDPGLPHPNQILVRARAGDVVIMNSHLWHGGTTNRTKGNRRVMHGYFARRHQPQQLDQQKYLKTETWNQLTEAERMLLGVVAPTEMLLV